MQFPKLPAQQLLARLEHPAEDRPVRVVMDTDTYNEIDDQFAVTYALLSRDRLQVEAIYAAPFHNDRSTGPADGMEKSFREIHRVLDRLKLKQKPPVYRGSETFMTSPETPVPSDAAKDLVRRAMDMPDEEPLYVIALGAITNVASAILLEPEIIRRIVVVWLGGHAFHFGHAREFNLMQDVRAARILFDSGVPLVLIPALGVTSHLHTTLPEIEAYVKGRGAIGDYLAGIFRDYVPDHFAYSKVIWDIAGVAYLLLDQAMDSELVHSPVINDTCTWSFDRSRHLIRYVSMVHRDVIFRDLFTKLQLSE